MTTSNAIVESFRRQAQCLDNLTTLLNAELLEAKPSADGWPIAVHLAHVQMCRKYWLEKASQREWPEIRPLSKVDGETYVASRELALIRDELRRSAGAILSWAGEAVQSAGPAGPYDHAVLFVQHMVWHEGYHYGLLNLALRLGGAEPDEEWEEKHVWQLWRGPE